MTMTKKQIVERIAESLWTSIDADKAYTAVVYENNATPAQAEEYRRIKSVIAEWEAMPASQVKAEAESVFGWK
jgi:fatty acid-binding protein DegV